MADEKTNYGNINLDYTKPCETDKDILLEELMTIRIEILRALARTKVVWEKVNNEKLDLDRNESTDEDIEYLRKMNAEEIEAAKNAITSLRDRLVALDLTFELVNGLADQKELIKELLDTEL